LIVILGAGIAGLSVAESLRGRTSIPIKVLERDVVPGGASRTVRFGEFRYDLGGHRFYTKKRHVQEFVERLIGPDLMVVDRISHIAFRGKMVEYPLSAFNALAALGPWEACLATGDYVLSRARQLFGKNDAQTFEQWTVSRFGNRLYRTFFKDYSEKLWGLPCERLSADFADQRIKGLSFREVVKDALSRRGKATTLVRRFLYPRLGFGMIPERMAAGWEPPNEVLCGMPAEKIIHDGRRILAVESRGVSFPVTHCVSSLPMDDLVRMLEPRPDAAVLEAAESLKYRDLVILFIALDRERVTDDHWVYFPDRQCPFARFHEPKNWSAAMAPADKTGLVVEFFCERGDGVWNAPAEQLCRWATDYLEALGMVRASEVLASDIQRVAKAYPVYELGYQAHVETILGYLDRFENLQSVGRNALFRYTSSDHYIDMGIRAAQNILGGSYDLRQVGTEPGYAEDGEFAAPTA